MMALPFWCLLVAVFGFIVWIPITKYHLLVAFALTLGTIAWGCQWDRKKSIKQGLVFTAMTLLCAGYASLFFERGHWWDGLVYHKPAVIEIKNGWNPVWEYNSFRDHRYDDPWELSADRWWIWSKHFPKADWYINAVFYAFSGNLDLGHLTRLFYLLVTFIVVFAAIGVIFRLPNYQSFLLSFVVALNPYTIHFCFSSYLDGALGSCLAILFFAFAAYLKSKDKRFLPFAIASIVIVTNFKFTGVVYVAVFLVCMLIPSAVKFFLTAKNAKKREGHKEHPFIDRPLTGSLVLATVLALIVGINPYLYHLYHHYTPFYPLHTVRNIDKPTGARANFEADWTVPNVGDANKWQQFFFCYLNTSDLHSTIPSHWNEKEYGVHTITVNKVPFGRHDPDGDNNFGSLFMVAMWFSLLMMPFIRCKEFWFLLLAVWASLWVQPNLWYARYIPHLWLIPVIVSCALLSQFNEVPEYRRRFEIIVGIVLLCMFVSVKPHFVSMPPALKELRTGIISYFMQKEPNALFFDVANSFQSEGFPEPRFEYSTKTYISDALPDYCFEASDMLEDNVAESMTTDYEAHISELLSQTPYSTGTRKRQLGLFLQVCPVYLVANNQSEFERLSSIEDPTRTEMVQAILHLRWQQFKRAWGME